MQAALLPVLFGTPKPKFKCDFTQISTLPNEITFSRAGNAMQFDATGALTWAPNNLLTYSNDLTQAIWTKSGTTVSGTAVAPDGSIAQGLIENGATSGHSASNTIAIAAGYTVLVTVIAKSFGDQFLVVGGGGTGRFFDLSAGILGGTTGFSVPLTSTITSLGNGWYQCSITFTSIGGIAGLQCYLSKNGTSISYAGDSTNGVYIAASRLSLVTYESAPRAGDNVATTTAAYYGPRFDNTPGVANSPLGLLIEEARTNYVTQFSPFTTGWALTTATIGTLVASPDGTSNASPVTNTAAYGFASTNMTLPVDTSTYCASVFIKKTVGATVFPGILLYVGSAYYSAAVNTNTGTVTARNTEPPLSSSITDAGTFWRVAITAPNASVAAASFLLCPAVNADAGANWTGGTGTTTFYGAQVEKGTFATSPIFTTTAAVTRAADIVPLGGALASIIKGTVGSVIMEATYYPNQTYAARILCDGNSGGSNIFGVISSTQFDNLYNLVSALNPILGSGLTTSRNRIGASFSSSGRSTVGNNGVVVSDTALKNAYAAAYLGTSNGSNMANMWVSGFVAWNKRLPNLTLKAKTVLGAPL